jgi:hypothetical protein
MTIRTPSHLRLNFPPNTTLERIAAELHALGYIISARRNRDGSHDVIERPSARVQAAAAQQRSATPVLEIEGL